VVDFSKKSILWALKAKFHLLAIKGWKPGTPLNLIYPNIFQACSAGFGEINEPSVNFFK